jgi:hypothetical protein
MKSSMGGRTWVKLWVHEWLEGTTRFQMTDAQRAFWIDLLAMAGRSRVGGIVCAGKDGRAFVGYPLSKFQGLLAEPLDIEATFRLFERTGKITLQVTGEGIGKSYVLFITNWGRYQSEYERTKQYRSAAATPNSADLLHKKYEEGHTTEGEGEGEGEGEKEKRRPFCSPPANAVNAAASQQSSASKPPVTTHAIELAALLRQLILKNNPGAQITARQVQLWGVTADSMLRLDHRTTEEITAVIQWSQRDNFWRSNILSMGKLREKFDQLVMKQNAEKDASEPEWRSRERAEENKNRESWRVITELVKEGDK